MGRRLVGGARLRHRLIPVLHLDGGHIGYEIRPSDRRRGYATELLRCVLAEAASRGLTRVLLTAAQDNAASIRVIESNGGEADGTSLSPSSRKIMRRYWISTAAGASSGLAKPTLAPPSPKPDEERS
ncbi:MAG: GNAT family N-acetyltransferase [Proteobacteria bacterium]|nr:GNAT family N-acetyltransferase [Pseudomonadota bacterium]